MITSHAKSFNVEKNLRESDEFKSTITASQITKDTIFIVLETSGSGTKDTDYELSSDSILPSGATSDQLSPLSG